MVTSRHRLFSAALATALAATALTLVPAAGAQAADTTYKACANKKTGAMRLVVKGKKCKKGEKKLKWNVVGPAGMQGPIGPKGADGARGPAGAMNVVDATGKVIGPMVGMFPYMLVRLPGGSLITWTNTPGSTNAVPLLPAAVYFRQAGCAGDGYAQFTGVYPFNIGIIMSATGAPGSPVYRFQQGTAQAFTSASTLTPTGCAASATAVTNAFVVKQVDTVPTALQPLSIEPVT